MTQSTNSQQLVTPPNGHETETAAYRLIHSSGELVFNQRTEACDAMRQRPGARVFVAPGAEALKQ